MSRVTKASYAVLAACFIAHFLNHIYTGALSPFLPLIRDELALTLTEVGIVTSSAITTMTVAHIIVGYFGDKGWRDLFIPTSVVMGGIVLLFSSLATTFFFLTTCMVLLGLGSSGYHPSAFPALTEKFPCSIRARATGIQAIGGLLGMAIIPALGVGLLVLVGGWRASLAVIGAIGVISFVPVLFLMRYSQKSCEGLDLALEDDDHGEDGWTKNYGLAILLMALRGMTFQCVALLIPLYLVEAYAQDPVIAGTLTTIMLTSGLFGELVSAQISDKIGRRVPFMILSTAIAAPCLLLLNYSLDFISLLVVLIILGFFYFLGVPAITAFMTEVSPRDSQGLAFGFLFSIGAIPGAISPIIFGYIGDLYGLTFSILYLVVTSTLATIVALFLQDAKKKSGTIVVQHDETTSIGSLR